VKREKHKNGKWHEREKEEISILKHKNPAIKK
jgi:hypothetical protein